MQGGATRIIDADGLLVTPGWVDVHTHYDGQATWDPELAPSSWHGVTTLVMGNCGVGFAPARPDRHDWLIGLMEGVEDIPGTALAEGIEWEWETFPEYLDALERRRWTVDVGTQVPHGAVRAYVMGERGAAQRAGDAPRTSRRCGPSCSRPSRAGALGFSTSRTIGHRAIDGELVPGHLRRPRTSSSASGPRWPRPAPACSSWPRWARPARCSRTPGRRSTGCAGSRPPSTGPCPTSCCRWTTTPSCGASSWPPRSRPAPRGPCSSRRSPGARPGMLTGHHATLCLFSDFPAYRGAAGPLRLSVDELAAALADPEVRRRITSWTPSSPAQAAAMEKAYERTFVLGDPPDYEPGPERSLAGLAAARGHDAAGGGLRRDGRATSGQGLLYIPILNYATGDLDHVHEMLLHPQGLLGLSDGGAHTGTICDASMPTFMLTHWTRDRSRGEHAAARVRGEEADARHGTPLRHVGPGHGRAGRAGRPQPHRLRRALRLGAPFVRGRPAGRRPPPAPEGRGVRGHHQEGDRDLRGRRADRRAPGPAGARRALSRPRVTRGAPGARRRPAGTADCTRMERPADPVRAARRRSTSATRSGAGPGPDGVDVLEFNSGLMISIDETVDEPNWLRYTERVAEFSRLIRFDAGGLGLSDPLPAGTDPSIEGWGRDALGRHGRGRAASAPSCWPRPAAPCPPSGWRRTHPERVTSLVLVNGTARVGQAEDYGFGVPTS